MRCAPACQTCARETSLRGQLQALDTQAADRDTYLKLADNLDGFLTRLRGNAGTARTEERQRVLRLLVKDVLIWTEKITIRHRIPAGEPATTPIRHHRKCAGLSHFLKLQGTVISTV